MSIKPELKCVGGTQMGASSATGRVALPGAVAKLEQVVLRELNTLLAAVFDNADDLFFDFAEKVKTESERNKYFDAMREVRIERKGIEQRFFKMIDAYFHAMPNPNSKLNNDVMAMTSLDSLSLVNHEDLEQNVAIEGMITKARTKHSERLFPLCQRLNTLIIDVEVSEKNNPLDPRQLCEAFKVALKKLQCDIKSVLIIYKLFEKFVLDRLERPLDVCNYLLAKAGILPELKNTPVVANRKKDNADKSAGEKSAGDKSKSVADVPADMTAYLQTLVAAVRQASMLSMVPGFSEAPIGSTQASAREIDNSQLVNVLTDVQRVMPRGLDVLQGQLLLNTLNVRNALDTLFAQRESKFGPERLTQRDTDIINLVGMLFDFILDDTNLPVRVKALIGRLQIPLVKVAVKDPAFFSANRHPARRLLNALARAGIGLPDKPEDLSKDGVFNQIQITVQTILDKFADDMGMFDQLLNQFETFMSSETRRAELVEQRTRSAEEGRALTEQARDVVAKLVATKLQDKRLPDILVQFIEDAWSSVLFRIYIKQGDTSKSWLAAVQTIDLLVQSVTPPVTDEERKALYNGLPVLQKRLREGLDTISYNPFAANEFVGRLEEVQLQVLRGETPAHLKADVATDPADQLLAAVKGDIDAKREGDALLTNRSAAYDAPQIRRIDQAKGFISQPKIVEPALPAMADDDEHLVRARHLGVGAWVEFVDEQGTKTRCKLAARIKTTDRLVFVNRAGIKVRDLSTLAVAHEMADCRMIILDDSLLFDRALQSVIGSLRRVRESEVAAGA